MAKTYINKTVGTDDITSARNIVVAAPFDVRTVVDTYDDLLVKDTFGYNSMYIGMLVITYDTQDVYVLSKLPKARDNAATWAATIQWKKVTKEFNPADFSARIVDSFDELTDENLDSPYVGMFAVVIDTIDSDSEDESGLYVLRNLPNTIASNWYRILVGSGSGEVPVGIATEEWVEGQGYLKAEDLPDFLQDSDLSEYVKFEDIVDFVSQDDIKDLASKADLDGFIKIEDLPDYLTESDLDPYLKISELPVNVSDFINDAGYITAKDLPDFLTSSDLDGYVKVEDLEPYLQAEDIADLAKKSDLDGYVKLEDAVDYLTASDLAPYLKISELPTNVSEFINDAGYLTEHQDLSDYATKEYVDTVAAGIEFGIPEKVSELANDAGYLTAEDLPDYLMDSDLDDYAKKSDIPTDVSTFNNDADYVTKDYVDIVAADIELNVQDSIITSDGSAPASGTGFSINENDESAYVENTYVDDNFEPGTYYTSNGLNSNVLNGGSELEDVDYITLTNGGESSIKLNSSDDENWIELDIVDDSLGFTMEDVTWIDENGVEHQMTESPLVLKKGESISFGDNTVDFTGMTETRGDDPTEYVFGETGSTYEDIDIYTSTVLPTVYAYADGTPVRVLTDGDKVEIMNKIDEIGVFEPITSAEIDDLF